MVTSVKRILLSRAEHVQVRSLLDEILREPEMSNQYSFMEKAALYAHELPRGIREAFYDFKRNEEDSALLVVGNPVLAGGPGPTPSRYVELDENYRLNDAEILHGLYGALLGEAIGFTSQRNGSTILLFPLKEIKLSPILAQGLI